jgi:para-nitrobenzyl esterase
MKVTIDTTLGTLLDDPKAKAVMEQQMPGISSNPMVAMARGMSLKMILSMPQAAQFGITEEKVNTILAEINKQL